MNRRSFLTSILALSAAPAADSLMKIVPREAVILQPYQAEIAEWIGVKVWSAGGSIWLQYQRSNDGEVWRPESLLPHECDAVHAYVPTDLYGTWEREISIKVSP